MSKIRFLGGAREVGASGIEIYNSNKSLVLDYGVRPRNEKPLPLEPSENLVGAVITHAHIDHSGAIPSLIKKNHNVTVIATPPTFELTHILLLDMLNIGRGRYPFGFKDAKKVKRVGEYMNYGNIFDFGEISIKLLNAGHIPGSSSVLVNANGIKIWYSGDLNTIPTNLTTPADKIPETDYVVIESTYALKEHPPREEVEKDFVETVTNCVERGGIALVPAFSVGRAQEVISILYKYSFEYPVILDGMARTVSELILAFPNYVRDYQTLRKALGKARWVKNEKERKQLLLDPKVVVSPAGMLQGGSAQYYMKHVYNDELSGIYLVGYQVPGTSGYKLLNEKVVRIGSKMKKVSAEVKSFELSSHLDGPALLSLLKAAPTNPKIFVVHGEPESAIGFANVLKENLGFDAVAPSEGDVFPLSLNL